MSTATTRPAIVIGLRLLVRELRAGEMRVLLAALAIAVAAVTAVGLFTDRTRVALERGASELLAADLVVSSPLPIDSKIERVASSLGLRSAHTLGFRSVVVHGERLQLAEVKAVGPGYPLRGTLATAAAPFAAGTTTREIPAPGTAWPDSRLAALLGVGVGDTIGVGRAELRIDRVLVREPDRGADLLNIAPRLMVNLADIERTGLVVPGSRVRYRLLLAGTERAVASARTALAPMLGPDERLQGVRDARPRIRTALERGTRFLGLAALVSVLLAGIAVALAAGRHVERQLDAVALLGCLGASRATVIGIQVTQIVALGAIGVLLGTAVGWIAQQGLARALAAFSFATLPEPHLSAFLQGPIVAAALLAGFALTPLARLRAVPPARVIRRELRVPGARSAAGYAAAIGVVALLVLWQADDVALAMWVLGGSAGLALVLALAALAMLQVLRPLRARVGVAWRFGLANLTRRPAATVAQVLAFGLGIMLLLLLTQVRGELLARWRASLPADAPNNFLINIQPDEVARLHAFLTKRGVAVAAMYPLVRGRIEELNGRRLDPADYTRPRSRHLARHTLNLSWTAKLPYGNRVVSGRWDPASRGTVSVERGFADALGIKVGDRLRLRIAERAVDATVASLREVHWDSFRPNFFVLAAPGLLDGFPATWMTSIDLPEDSAGLLRDLVDRFPSVTVLDVDALLGKVREIMDHAASGIEYVLAFALVAGLVVLLAAVQTTVDARRRETAVVRTLGGDRRRLLQSLVAEFATLGALAGALAACGAAATASVVAARIFDLAYVPGIGIWASGIVAGVVAVAVAGVLATRSVLDQPPVDALRAI